MKRKSIILCFPLFLCFVGFLKAQSTNLDKNFGGNGRVIQDIVPSNVDIFYTLRQQADGKLITAGSVKEKDYLEAVVSRFDTSGRPDSTFGAHGILRIVEDTFNNRIQVLRIQPDQKIVVAGFVQKGSDRKIYVARLLTNGNFDSTFGDNGRIIRTDITGEIFTMKLFKGNKIMVGGSASVSSGKSDFILLKFNNNGMLDSSFGLNGISRFGNGTATHALGSIDTFNDGSIVTGGGLRSTGTSQVDFAVTKLNSNGTVDPAFGINGYVVRDMGGNNDQVPGIKVLSNGNILAGGYATANFAALKLKQNGDFDSTFNNNGILTLKAAKDFRTQAFHFQKNTIIAAGFYDRGVNSAFGLIRVLPNGRLDSSLGENGFILNQLDTPANRHSVLDIVRQEDGKLVLCGSVKTLDGNTKAGLMRYRWNTDEMVPEGGEISTSDPIVICVDSTKDYVEVTLNGPSADSSVWVVTNELGKILLLPDSNVFNLDFGGSENCLIWSLSYIDKYPYGLTIDNNIHTDLWGNYAFSDSIHVIKHEIIITLDSIIHSSGNNGEINISVTGGTTPYTYAWSNGENTEDISGLTPGNYNVGVSDINSCSSDMGPIKVNTVTSVNRLRINKVATIYPNPATSYVTLETLSKNKSNFSMDIYTLNGKLVMHKNELQATEIINLTEFKAGSYQLKLTNTVNRKIYSSILIVQ